jgi:Sec-independent protein translocase protein TatA
MDFLGVGPLELLFVLLIALIVLGPNDMVKAGRTLGKWLRKLVTSPTWQAIQQTSRDIRLLPNKLMRDAGLEEDLKELNEIQKNVQSLRNIRPDLGLDEVEKELKKAEQDLRATQADLSAWTTPPPESAPTVPAVETPEVTVENQPPKQEATDPEANKS